MQQQLWFGCRWSDFSGHFLGANCKCFWQCRNAIGLFLFLPENFDGSVSPSLSPEFLFCLRRTSNRLPTDHDKNPFHAAKTRPASASFSIKGPLHLLKFCCTKCVETVEVFKCSLVEFMSRIECSTHCIADSPIPPSPLALKTLWCPFPSGDHYTVSSDAPFAFLLRPSYQQSWKGALQRGRHHTRSTLVRTNTLVLSQQRTRSNRLCHATHVMKWPMWKKVYFVHNSPKSNLAN